MDHIKVQITTEAQEVGHIKVQITMEAQEAQEDVHQHALETTLQVVAQVTVSIVQVLEEVEVEVIPNMDMVEAEVAILAYMQIHLQANALLFAVEIIQMETVQDIVLELHAEAILSLKLQLIVKLQIIVKLQNNVKLQFIKHLNNKLHWSAQMD